MGEWIRWWKDRTFLTILITCIVAMILSFVFARYFIWGWIASLFIGVISGLFIRGVIVERLDDECDED